MKYLVLILLLIPLVYAQDLSLSKEIYYPQETFQAEVFMENLNNQDISVLNSLNFPSSIGVNLNKISNAHYFISFNIPETTPGIYTLKIKETQKQFEIKPKKTRVFSISPAFIKYTSQDKTIQKIIITNHNTQPETVEITSDSVIPSINSITLPLKSSKSFFVKLDTTQTKNSLAILSIADYNIPIWFIADNEIISFLDKEIEITQETQEGLQFYIKSEGDIIDLNYLTKEIEESIPITGSLYIKNNLNESLNNLKISLTGNLQDIVKLETTEFDLATGEEKRLDIIINEDRILLEDSYSGDLIISNDKSVLFKNKLTHL